MATRGVIDILTIISVAGIHIYIVVYIVGGVGELGQEVLSALQGG